MAALGRPPQTLARSSSSGTRSSGSSSCGRRGPALLHHPPWRVPLAKAPLTGLPGFPVHLSRSGVTASPGEAQQRGNGAPSATRQGRGLGSARGFDQQEDWEEDAASAAAEAFGKAEARRGASGVDKAAFTQQVSSLDDLCPSLDSEAWDLLQERPAVPSPPPQQLWADGTEEDSSALGQGEGEDWDSQAPLWGYGGGAPGKAQGGGRALEDPSAAFLGPREGAPGSSEWGTFRRAPGSEAPGVGTPDGRQRAGARGWPSLPPEWVPEREFRRDTGTAQRVATGGPAQGWRSRQNEAPARGPGETEEDYELRQEHWRVRRGLYGFLHVKYSTGEELSPTDAEFVIENALRFHPRAAAKMGERVIGIKVDVHPEFSDTKCFFVKSLGASDWLDFSYLKCLEARFRSVITAQDRGGRGGGYDRRQRGQGQWGGGSDRRSGGGGRGGGGYGRAPGGGGGYDRRAGAPRDNGSALGGFQGGYVGAAADSGNPQGLPRGQDLHADA